MEIVITNEWINNNPLAFAFAVPVGLIVCWFGTLVIFACSYDLIVYLIKRIKGALWNG